MSFFSICEQCYLDIPCFILNQSSQPTIFQFYKWIPDSPCLKTDLCVLSLTAPIPSASVHQNIGKSLVTPKHILNLPYYPH